MSLIGEASSDSGNAAAATAPTTVRLRKLRRLRVEFTEVTLPIFDFLQKVCVEIGGKTTARDPTIQSIALDAISSARYAITVNRPAILCQAN